MDWVGGGGRNGSIFHIKDSTVSNLLANKAKITGIYYYSTVARQHDTY